MKSSIVVTTLRRPELLLRLLRATEALCESEFEMIVVCDGPDASTRTVADSIHLSYPVRWVFNCENVGLAESRNIGAREARHELLLFLDDDCVPQSGWLHHHRKHNETAERVVLGRIVDTYETEPSSRTEGTLRSRAQEEIDFDAVLLGTDRERESLHCAGRNSSMRRSTWSRVGGFDARLRFTAEEDTEFGLRLYAAGVKFVYEPRAVVHHVMTKDPIAYLLDGAAVLAKCDLYRVHEKNQRVPMMFSMYNGRRLRRWRERIAWHFPRLTDTTSDVCRHIVEATGSRRAFYAWQRLSFSWRYWHALRQLGVSLADVRAMTATRANHR